ncbi:MAG: TIGR03545 family protein [Elusimicrobiota bacterium]
MIRWSYVGSRAALLALVWAFFAFAVDPLARRAFEKSASRALGAKVTLRKLNTRVLPPTLRIAGLAAADPSDPMRDLLRVEKARFSFEAAPLLERKLVIRAAEVEGVTWGAPRKRSGAVRREPPSQASVALAKWAGGAKDLGLGGAASAKADLARSYTVKPEDLSSVKLARALEEGWPARFDAWKKKTDAFDAEGRIRELSDLAGKAGAGEPASRLAALGRFKERSEALRKDAAALRSGVEGELAAARADLKAVEAAKAADLAELEKRLHLPRFDSERLSAYLVGEQGAKRLSTALRVLAAARKRMPSKGEPSAKEAARGVTVEFPRAERSLPGFWLRQAKLTGSAELGTPLAFGGEAVDFSSNPPLLAEPARLRLGGGADGRKLLISAELDHRRPTPRDVLEFRLDGQSVGEFTAGDPASFSVGVGAGTADVSGAVTLAGDALSGRVDFVEKGVRLVPRAAGLDPALARALASALEGVDVLKVGVVLGGTLQQPELRVESNLGGALSGALGKALGKEAAARAGELRAQVDRLAGERVKGLQGQLDARAKGLLGSLGVEERLGELQKRALGGGKPLPDLRRLFR